MAHAQSPDSTTASTQLHKELTNGIQTSKPLSEILFPAASENVPPEPDTCDWYKWTMDDLNKTLITSWYENFGAFRTIPTFMLPLSPDVVAYLQDDEVHLPQGVQSSGLAAVEQIREQNGEFTLTKEEEDAEDSDAIDLLSLITTGDSEYKFTELVPPRRFESSDSDEEDFSPKIQRSVDDARNVMTERKQVNKFIHLDRAIEEVIRSFKNKSAFPKLNWKSPKDAAWIAMNKSLRSYVPGDIYLLLKSSNRISDMWDKDFFKNCSDWTGEDQKEYVLILRQWMDIHPATEFRCFVANRRFIAISQREYTASYPGILESRDGIMEDLFEFYCKVLIPRVDMTHYVFDVVRLGPKKVILIDLNVFGRETDGCLWNYEELKVLSDEKTFSGKMTNGASETGDSASGHPHPPHGSGTGIGQHNNNGPTFRFVDSDRMVIANPWIGSPNGPTSELLNIIGTGMSLHQLEEHDYGSSSQQKQQKR